MPTPNQLAHFAINADDLDRARAFYSRVFGWTFAAWGPPGFYQIQNAGPYAALQARRELAAGQRMTGFECTIAVASIDAAERAVLAGGGSVAMPRSVIAGVGTLMFFRDTEGNTSAACSTTRTPSRNRGRSVSKVAKVHVAGCSGTRLPDGIPLLKGRTECRRLLVASPSTRCGR